MGAAAASQARSATRSPSRPWGRSVSTRKDDEGEDVLVVAAEDAAGEGADVTGTERLDQAEQDAAHHRPGEVADAAEHGRRERLQARQEAHRVLHRSVIRGVHDAGQRRQGGADDESGGDDRVGPHAHEGSDARVLGGGAHGPAELGAVDEVHEAAQGDDGGHQDQDLHVVDDGAEDLVRLGRQQDRERLVVRLPDDHGQRLQQQAHAHGRDERRQSRRVAKRPVGDLLDREVQRRANDDGGDQADEKKQPARQAEAGQRRHHRPARQRAHHQHIAVREVDEVDDPVDHRVAERHQCVDAAQNEAVDDLLDEDIHAPS